MHDGENQEHPQQQRPRMLPPEWPGGHFHGRREPFRRALSRTVSTIDVPFGYTLSIWSSGYLIAGRFGAPHPLEIFLFLTGAVLGYLLLAAASLPHFTGEGVTRMPGLALLNVMALVTAVAVSVIASLGESPSLGFLLGGFTATAVYTLALTLIIYIGERVGVGIRPPEE